MSDYNDVSVAFQAIVSRLSINGKMNDLLREYGIDNVYSIIEDVASFYDDVEEIGSSDVSIMVKSVEQNLEELGQDSKFTP